MELHIQFNDLLRQNGGLRRNLDEAYARVMQSGWYILGTEGSRFEEEFADYCGTSFAAGVANGSDALEIALRALDLKAGARVATVANAGGYTTAALMAVGYEPLFVDVERDTQLVSIDRLAKIVEAGMVSAAVVTHLFGRMVDVEAIAVLCARHGIPIIEDCAQAHGARLRGRLAGSIGQLGCFSFYPTKNLGALGDGGAIVTSSVQLNESVRRLRQYGWTRKYNVGQMGGRNSRLDELQAAFLRAKLPFLDRWNGRRREIAGRYRSGLDRPGVLAAIGADTDYVGHLYVVRCENRDALAQHLRSRGIGCDIHYPIPDTRQPAWERMFSDVRLSETEASAAEILSLPCYPELTNDEVDFVIQTVNGW